MRVIARASMLGAAAVGTAAAIVRTQDPTQRIALAVALAAVLVGLVLALLRKS